MIGPHISARVQPNELGFSSQIYILDRVFLMGYATFIEKFIKKKTWQQSINPGLVCSIFTVVDAVVTDVLNFNKLMRK